MVADLVVDDEAGLAVGLGVGHQFDGGEIGLEVGLGVGHRFAGGANLVVMACNGTGLATWVLLCGSPICISHLFVWLLLIVEVLGLVGEE
uniref:Uncharacterized protein n=1 Tax=Fagus sylvatica TaxID=28930 RepID=A0A2N9EK46_FAGSY